MVHVIVIGAYGSAGVAVADELVADPTVDELTLVDDGDPGGGLCILRGCMPSKELLSAATHRHQVRHDDRLDGDPSLDLASVVETKDDHVENFAAHRRAAVDRLTEAEHVEFVHGTARFVDDRVVRVGDRRFDPDYVVVAIGSSVSLPDLPGLDRVDPRTSADVLDATSVPDSGVVMGFGVVGLELVPYLVEAGVTDLTVIEHDARPLDQADPVFGDAVLDCYRDEFGVEILTHATERRVEPTADGGVRLHVDHDGERTAVDADQLYLFTGRRPNLDSLDLDATSLTPEPGWVRDTMQARGDDRVFVVGDGNGREPILHVAKEEGHLAAENVGRHVAGERLREYENTHHRVVFSGAGVYPYARVGHTESSAAAAGISAVSATREASRDGVFVTKATPHGLARLVADADDGTVLGYQGLHYHADVMAKTMQVVVERRMTVGDVPDRAFHPTTPEIIDGLLRELAERLDAA
jgi:dihydrolipoamide dehydrogenase